MMDKNNSNNPTKDDEALVQTKKILAIQARIKKDDENVESDEFKPNQFNEVQTEANIKFICLSK